MPARLSKFHGLANDFLVALEGQPDAPARLDARTAQRWCDRRTGIGADGLILGALPGTAAGAEPVDVVMVLWNRDGSRAEMSGNGIRCLAHAVARARGGTSGPLRIATDAGLRAVEVQLADADGHLAEVRVEMGALGPGPALPPELEAHLAAAFDRPRTATVDVGNPHLVVEVADPTAVDLVAEGTRAERHFADGINVELISVVAPDALELVVWERGAGVTRACGTGATAAAATARAWGLVGERVEVRMPGGAATVELVGDRATLVGPSVHIADLAVAGSTGGGHGDGGGGR